MRVPARVLRDAKRTTYRQGKVRKKGRRMGVGSPPREHGLGRGGEGFANAQGTKGMVLSREAAVVGRCRLRQSARKKAG